MVLAEFRNGAIIWASISAICILAGAIRKSILIASIGIHHLIPLIAVIGSVMMATGIDQDNIFEWIASA